jgi:integral membrane sensor domain MASE1
MLGSESSNFEGSVWFPAAETLIAGPGEEAGVWPRAVSAILLGHHSLLAFREG